MTLGFSLFWKNCKPTFFIERIIKSLPEATTRDIGIALDMNLFDMVMFDVVEPKIHTIRKDSKDRWKAGKLIHFVVRNRTPNRFQFAPVVKVKSIQLIEIEKLNYTATWWRDYIVSVDGKRLTANDIARLAINDGFEDVESFFEYFNGDFTGKIIHWTDFKY